MKINIYLVIALIFAVLFTMKVEAKDLKTVGLKTILGQEHKAVMLSHLRANPEPRSEIGYNEFAKKEVEQFVTSANFKL